MARKANEMRYFVQAGLLAFFLTFNLLWVLIADLKTPCNHPPPALNSSEISPLVRVNFDRHQRFGLVSTIGDPNDPNDDNKKLTYSEVGETNNTRISLDEGTPVLAADYMIRSFEETLKDGETAHVAVWNFNNLVEVEQQVSYVLSPATGRKDAIRIAYKMTNADQRQRKMALRILLDTLIGDNDGVPFIIPGRKDLVTRAIDLRGKNVPDYIQALEYPSLTRPGVIVNITFAGGGATRPDRVVISAWDNRNNEAMEWDYFQRLGGEGHALLRGGQPNGVPDSAVGVYYGPETLAPGASKTMVMFYGLGWVSAQDEDLGLTSRKLVSPGSAFQITALVKTKLDHAQVHLELPRELRFASGEEATKTASAAKGESEVTPLSWNVRCRGDSEAKDVEIKAILSPGNKAALHTVTIGSGGLVARSSVSVRGLWLVILLQGVLCGCTWGYFHIKSSRR